MVLVAVGSGWAKVTGEQSVIEVRQVVADDADEAWERVAGEPDVRGVDASRFDFAGGWNVTVAVMEFVREESKTASALPPLRSAPAEAACGDDMLAGTGQRSKINLEVIFEQHVART